VALKSGLEVLNVTEDGTTRKLWYDFLFAFYSNYGRIISEKKRDIGRNFFIHPEFDAPVGILPQSLV